MRDILHKQMPIVNLNQSLNVVWLSKKEPKTEVSQCNPTPEHHSKRVCKRGKDENRGKTEDSGEMSPHGSKKEQVRGIKNAEGVQTRHYSPPYLITTICRPHRPLVLVCVLVRNIFRQPCYSRETLLRMGTLHVYKTLWGDTPLLLHFGSPG